VFSTEGHIFPLDKRFRLKPWENKEESKTEEESTRVHQKAEIQVLLVLNGKQILVRFIKP
jgi:hypothetical protein